MRLISQHKIFAGIALVVVVIVGWYMLSSSSTLAPSLTTTPVQSAGDQNLVSTLLALRAVKLDASIFSDPAFMGLKDFSTQIVPEPVGRQDPFAPLSVTPSTSATSTHNAQIFSPRR